MRHLAGGVAERQSELRHGVALLRGAEVPRGGAGQVLSDPPPLAQAHARIVLRRCVAQLSRALKHLECLRL